MAKKVIDIIPPATRPAAQSDNLEEIPLKYSQYPQSEPLPEVEKIPAKPKVTYVARREYPQSETHKKSFLTGLLTKLVFAAAIVGAAMYGFDVKFAKAVVKIWPATSELREETKISVNPTVASVDRAKNAIPGYTVSVEKTVKGESEVTGRKNVQGKAQGSVKIFNNYTSAQRLVKGTRLEADVEKFQPPLAKDESPWFRTTEDVTLEPKSSAAVKVIADKSGEKYNIEPAIFNIPGLVGTPQYTFIYGQSFEKFQGGTQDNAFEVKKEDIEKAKADIVELAKDEIARDLEAKAKEQGLEIIDASVAKFEFGDAVIPVKAGDGVPKISAQIAAKATTIAYRKADLESLGRDFVASRIPAGNIANDKSLKMTSSYSGIDTTSGRPSLSLSAQLTVYSGIGENDLKKGLSEKSVNEARIFLMNQTGMKDVKIQVSPPWRFSIPRDLDRIEVETILE